MISMGRDVWPKCSTTIYTLDELVEFYDLVSQQDDSLWLRSFILYPDFSDLIRKGRKLGKIEVRPLARAMMLVDRETEEGVVLYEVHSLSIGTSKYQDADLKNITGIKPFLDHDENPADWFENGYCNLSQKELQKIFEALFSLSESSSGEYLEQHELWGLLTKATGNRPICLYAHTYLPSYESINNQDIKYLHNLSRLSTT